MSAALRSITSPAVRLVVLISHLRDGYSVHTRYNRNRNGRGNGQIEFLDVIACCTSRRRIRSHYIIDCHEQPLTNKIKFNPNDIRESYSRDRSIRSRLSSCNDYRMWCGHSTSYCANERLSSFARTGSTTALHVWQIGNAGLRSEPHAMQRTNSAAWMSPNHGLF